MFQVGSGRLMRGLRTLLVYHSLQHWKPWCLLIIIGSLISKGEGHWLMKSDPKKGEKKWFVECTETPADGSLQWLPSPPVPSDWREWWTERWAAPPPPLAGTLSPGTDTQEESRGESQTEVDTSGNSKLQVSTGTLCRDKEAWIFHDLLSCSFWQNKNLSLSVCGSKDASAPLKKKWIALIQKFFNFSFIWTQISLMDLDGKEQWSGLAAKFGQMCQMARGMALQYRVWSVTIQFSQFSTPQPFIRIYFCHSPNSRTSSIII